jgi:hypothetical protein
MLEKLENVYNVVVNSQKEKNKIGKYVLMSVEQFGITIQLILKIELLKVRNH